MKGGCELLLVDVAREQWDADVRSGAFREVN